VAGFGIISVKTLYSAVKWLVNVLVDGAS